MSVRNEPALTCRLVHITVQGQEQSRFAITYHGGEVDIPLVIHPHIPSVRSQHGLKLDGKDKNACFSQFVSFCDDLGMETTRSEEGNFEVVFKCKRYTEEYYSTLMAIHGLPGSPSTANRGWNHADIHKVFITPGYCEMKYTSQEEQGIVTMLVELDLEDEE